MVSIGNKSKLVMTLSRSVAFTVKIVVPTGKLSGMVALYQDLLKIGEWSFSSTISMTTNVSVVRFGLPSEKKRVSFIRPKKTGRVLFHRSLKEKQYFSTFRAKAIHENNCSCFKYYLTVHEV